MPSIPLESAIVLLAFLAGFASVLVTVLPFMRGNPRAARLRSVAERRQELSKQQREELAHQRARQKPQASTNLMKAVVDRLRLQNLLASPELHHKLAMAGWRRQSAVVAFVFARLALATGFGLFTLLVVSLGENIHLSTAAELAATAIAGLVGFYLPNVLVTNAGQKRQAEMTSSFPDMLDLMVICVEAGLSIEAAFTRVTEEIADSSPVLAEEIGLTSAELTFLGDRSKAYANLAVRTGLPAAKSLTTALIQSERYGTPVSVALKVLAQENRNDRMAKAEQKAGALPAQLTVPMIIFFLPVLFLVIIGPAIIQMMKM